MQKTSYMNGIDNTKVGLTDLVLKQDMNGCYYLGAKYRIEDDNSIRELHIPKMLLNVNHSNVFIKRESCYENDRVYAISDRPEVDIGFGYFPVMCEDPRNNIYFTMTTIEEKTREMTLDEIEKKLGHKVKIVNK